MIRKKKVNLTFCMWKYVTHDTEFKSIAIIKLYQLLISKFQAYSSPNLVMYVTWAFLSFFSCISCKCPMVGPLISISFKKLTMGFIKCEQILCTICFMWKIFIVVDMLQSGQIKHTPQDCINEFIILKVESIGSCRVQFHLCTPACVMSSEFTREVVMKFLAAQFSWIWCKCL